MIGASAAKSAIASGVIANPFLIVWLTPNLTLKTQLGIVPQLPTSHYPIPFKQDLVLGWFGLGQPIEVKDGPIDGIMDPQPALVFDH